MSLWLVNTSPGENSEPLVPGQALHLGLKSSTSSVVLGSLGVKLGFSGIDNGGVLPEIDAALAAKGAMVSVRTMENRNPIGAALSRAIAGGALRVTADGTTNSKSITDIKTAIASDASVLGFFQFKYSSTWASINPDWTNLTACKGMVFGLEYGPYNTALTAFLHDDGVNGELVVGGPLSAFGARPAQTSFPFPWKTFADGEIIQLFIYMNNYGLPAPFSPAYTPLFEIWTKRAADAGPTLLGTVLAGSLGFFPTSLVFDNSRTGPSDTCTLFFGNVGGNGDILEVQDWALFPDFRVSIYDGFTTPDHASKILPDSPIQYHASQGLPGQVRPGRWMNLVEGVPPTSVPYYQPGRKLSPFYTSIVKTEPGGATGFQKTEPRLIGSADGFMVEAFVSVEDEFRSNDCTGAGFLVDDGAHVFKVLALETATVRTWGLLKDASAFGDLASGYHLALQNGSPRTIDFRSLKLLRLTVDRRRGFVYLDVDGERVISKLIADPFPVSAYPGRFGFGYIADTVTAGKLNVAFLNYLQRYFAFEAADGLLPTHSNVLFAANSVGLNSVTLANNLLVIDKPDVSSPGTYNYFSIAQDFTDTCGLQVDFSVKVNSYTDLHGTKFPSTVKVGAGVTAFLGSKKVVLGFYDCGIHGKKIGILPGSGSDDDIINQTDLGRVFSVDADWTQFANYRLVVKAYDSIQVFGAKFDTPLLTIPWKNEVNGFDLPLDATTPALAFGHFTELESSNTSWNYIRWGVSNGYEVSVEQKFPTGMKPYLFGGKAFVSVDFAEGSPSVVIGTGDGIPPGGLPSAGGLPSVPPTTPPSGRYSAAFVYDSARNVAILFGGKSGPTVYSDTWEYNFATSQWSLITTVGSPGPLYDMAYAWDSLRNRMIIYGGTDNGNSTHNETWSYHNGVWTNLSPAYTPPTNVGWEAAYDTVRDRVVMLGGLRGGHTVFEFDGTNWASVAPRNNDLQVPIGTTDPAVAFSPFTSSVWEAGGNLSRSLTWQWDGLNWNRRSVSGPQNQGGNALSWSPVDSKMLLVEKDTIGGGPVVLTKEFIEETSSWVQLAPAASPSSRTNHHLAIVGSHVYLFGGLEDGTGNAMSDLWWWDGTTWQLVSYAGSGG